MIHLPPEAIEKLHIYQSLLLKWQKSVNLVSNSTLQDSWKRHFLDSAQLYPLIQKPNPTIVDVGSGAGFPGLVLAIVIKGEFHLVESDKKKCVFLSEVSRETNTSIVIHNDRIENISIPNIDIIVSRACANVSSLFELTEHLVSHETRCLFLKGKNHSIEVDEARKTWQFHINFHPSITEETSSILEITNIERRKA